MLAAYKPILMRNPEPSPWNIIEVLKECAAWSVPDVTMWFPRQVLSNGKGSE